MPPSILKAIKETPEHKLGNPIVAAAVTSILSNGFKLLQESPAAQELWNKGKGFVKSGVKKFAKIAFEKMKLGTIQAMTSDRKVPAGVRKRAQRFLEDLAYNDERFQPVRNNPPKPKKKKKAAAEPGLVKK